MKKFIIAAVLFLSGVFLSGAVFLFADPQELLGWKEKDSIEVMHTGMAVEENRNQRLLSDAYAVAKTLRDRDYVKLSEWIHPELGVVFVPYSTVDARENQHFQASEVRNFAGMKESYVWGVVDGEGSPISMTPSEYFDRYVFDYDFLKAPILGINTVVKSGNSLENVKDAFPGAEFVEFHSPGTAEYDGIDWKSLKLVFDRSGDGRKLIAIIHGEWTI